MSFPLEFLSGRDKRSRDVQGKYSKETAGSRRSTSRTWDKAVAFWDLSCASFHLSRIFSFGLFNDEVVATRKCQRNCSRVGWHGVSKGSVCTLQWELMAHSQAREEAKATCPKKANRRAKSLPREEEKAAESGSHMIAFDWDVHKLISAFLQQHIWTQRET